MALKTSASAKLKKSGNFLRFSFDGYDLEIAHLQKNSEQHQKTVMERVMELSREGRSIRKIASELNLSSSTVNRMIKAYNNITLISNL